MTQDELLLRWLAMVGLLQPLIVLHWAALLALLYGVGRLVQAATVGRAASTDFTLNGWLGFAGCLTVLQLWQLVGPVGTPAAAGLAALGGAGLAIAWRQARGEPNDDEEGQGTCQWLRAKAQSPKRWIVALLVLGAAWWLAEVSRGPIRPYDAGLYHLQTMAWFRHCRIVPGLGNLYPRLAYNSSYFLWLAALDGWVLRAHTFGAGVLGWIALGDSLLAARELTRAKAAIPVSVLFRVLAPLAVVFVLVRALGGTSNDLPVTLLVLALLSALLRLAEGAPWRPWLTGVLVLAAAGVTLKLSFGAFGLAAVGAALALTWRRLRDEGWRWTWRPGLLGAVLVLTWLGRGAILSGYPMFPSTLVALDLPWTMPAELVREEAQSIIGFARNPEVSWREALDQPDWFGPWARRMWGVDFRYVALPLLLALGALPLALGKRGRPPLLPWLSLAPPLVALAAWLATAPAARFVVGCTWGLGLLTLALAAARWLPNWGPRARLGVGLAVLLVAVLADRHRLAGPDQPGHGELAPTAYALHYTNNRGLCVGLPQSGDQTWERPLATPRHLFRGELRLLDPPYPNQPVMHPHECTGGFTLRPPEEVPP